jgi:formate dehydrogenase major subunit
LRNLALITGKAGKTAAGLLSLKEKNNSHGIFDMGGCAALAPGARPMTDKPVRTSLANAWGVDHISDHVEQEQFSLLKNGNIKNAFIFAEDPLGCAINTESIKEVIEKVDFLVVQDLFMSETAKEADLVLPASIHFETGGSFTNSQKFIQQFPASYQSPMEINSVEQLVEMLRLLGVESGYESTADILMEAAGLMRGVPDRESIAFALHHTTEDNLLRRYDHGCDVLIKRFDSVNGER